MRTRRGRQDSSRHDGRRGTRLLVALLAVQLVLAGLLVAAAVTGFSFIRELVGASVTLWIG